jgi:hypothetical protein
MNSCESDNNTYSNDSQFKLVFSDSTTITENDILFYDSSCHLLFLKNDLNFTKMNLQFNSDFSVFVNNYPVYTGIVRSCALSSAPQETFYISDCFFYGFDIIEFNFCPYSADLRNDPRIIHSLEENDLLRSGLSCTIDSVNVVKYEDHSDVFCKITIVNNDLIDYYILNPNKMGELDFNYYTGGLRFESMDSSLWYFLRQSVDNPDWSTVTMSDFSVLPGKSKVSFTINSSDYYPIIEGYYKVTFRFSGLHGITSDFNLSQDSGRIWIGEAISIVDNILVE